MIETSGNIETIDSKTPGSDIIHWQYSLDTIAIGTLDARSMEWTGNSEMLVVRLHPEYWTFASRYYRSLPAEQRLSAQEWLQQTKSSIVINAGQYGTDFRHLGWFVHQSRNLGTRQHPIWKGLFTGDPKPGSGLPLLQIHDLQETPLTLERLPFQEAAQSLMLFDTRGTIRVNRSNRHARRCIIAEDHQGFLYIFVTRGECTLWNLARYLMKLEVSLKHAMSLDGGAQAQISLKVDDTEINIPGFQIAIPCAICFSPVPPESAKITPASPSPGGSIATDINP